MTDKPITNGVSMSAEEGTGRLKYSYDVLTDVMEIEGIRYSGGYFRALAAGVNEGDTFKMGSRKSGVLEILRVVPEQSAYDRGFTAGRMQGISEGDKCTKTSAEIAYAVGFREAVERAAKVVYLAYGIDGDTVEADIRQLKPE